MKQKTYREWRDAGYQVIRGETASGRNAQGIATFSRSQVYPRSSYHGREDMDELWESLPMTEEDFLGFTPGDQ